MTITPSHVLPQVTVPKEGWEVRSPVSFISFQGSTKKVLTETGKSIDQPTPIDVLRKDHNQKNT